jgi:hypothetical protein
VNQALPQSPAGPLGPVSSVFIGTPLPARTTASPVTGTWGTGQSRTAGNLLVAVITAAAGTSAAATAQNAGTSGWANQAEAGNAATANARVSVWTKTAAGADAAPAFTSALAGTAAMTCTLFEVASIDTTTPLDTSGTYASGSGSGNVTFAVTTGAAVTQTGDAAISVFCQERTAAILTWSETGTGWASAYSDGATSSLGHTQVNTMTGVTQGATLSDGGSFSTKNLAFGAGAVVVLRAVTPPLVVFPPFAMPAMTGA